MSVVTHRRIDMLLARYAESHRHPLNEAIHCICVPAIVLSLLGLSWAAAPWLALIVVIASLAYYLTLSPAFALGMLAMAGAMLLILSRLPAASVLPASVAIFVASWIGQFVGHKVEGKKPSFFEDLRFLLIGPLFVLSLLYRRWRIPY
ncbi:DUF962 domain-containing protein [Herbaspirillum rhizosphaerae]|uniref:Mpo1 family 2-hydroxy fatty acid dioxygenase n=1 Tax=Herbaspirillum rhizosphaerae TaxID=346179 RepID=UPI00067DF41E|nr:Mpo1-like protein [Herbaspirillum rhizosphaerae]